MQIEYRNSARLLAVIGDPAAHSLSPLLQNTMLRALGLDALYLCCTVPAQALPRFLDAAKTLNFLGFNATMPHKTALCALCDSLSDEAEAYGAVNSVRLENGRLLGHNTDGRGFARSLADAGTGFAGRRVTILGAGGASRAIALRAVRDGAAAVRIRNRTPEKAEALCALAPDVLEPVSGPLPADTELLIGALSLAGQEAMDFSELDRLAPDTAVFDILYSPPVTPLLGAARARGLTAHNGLGMLIYQAIYAMEFFTGEHIDDAGMAALLRQTLQEAGIQSA